MVLITASGCKPKTIDRIHRYHSGLHRSNDVAFDRADSTRISHQLQATLPPLNLTYAGRIMHGSVERWSIYAPGEMDIAQSTHERILPAQTKLSFEIE